MVQEKEKKCMPRWKETLRRFFRFSRASARARESGAIYDQDGLRCIHNHAFMHDPEFCRAYQRGVAAVGSDHYHWQWRVHIGLWVASNARCLPGDFVECGVNYGFLSSAIMAYLDWNRMDKTFYLLDTFQGFDPRYLTAEERDKGALDNNQAFLRSGHYVSQVESVRANFAEWRNVRLIVGSVPDSLSQVTSEKVAYLHLDMNCALPEVAAAEFFWERLVPGGLVLMDDYCYQGFEEQQRAHDDFAQRKGVSILSLPTGQGLMIKPPVPRG
jgi:hypothetical protein